MSLFFYRVRMNVRICVFTVNQAIDKRDVNLLQIYGHYKRIEALSEDEQYIQNAIAQAGAEQNEDVIGQLEKWVYL